jgi:hypothetical protein
MTRGGRLGSLPGSTSADKGGMFPVAGGSGHATKPLTRLMVAYLEHLSKSGPAGRQPRVYQGSQTF